MNNLNEALAMLALAGGCVVVIFIIAKYTYLIKKAMIEKGLTNLQTNTKTRYLDIGCIVLGLGIGLMIATIFTEMNLSEDTTDLLVWGTIAICSGLGLITAHKLRNNVGK